MNSRILPFIAILVTATLTVTAALAGYASTFSVSASSTHGAGAHAAARNSSDSVQYIGCATSVTSAGSELGYCQARNASGTYSWCMAANSNQRRVMRSLSANGGYVNYTIDSSGNCLYFSTGEGSQYLP